MGNKSNSQLFYEAGIYAEIHNRTIKGRGKNKGDLLG